MADNVEIQGLEFQIQEDSAEAVKGLDALTSTLERLKTATGGGVSGLRTTAKQLTALNTALSGLGQTACDVILRVSPEKAPYIKSEIIDGQKCLIIPVEEDEQINLNGVTAEI